MRRKCTGGLYGENGPLNINKNAAAWAWQPLRRCNGTSRRSHNVKDETLPHRRRPQITHQQQQSNSKHLTSWSQAWNCWRQKKFRQMRWSLQAWHENRLAVRGGLCTKIAINCKIADLTMTPHQSKDTPRWKTPNTTSEDNGPTSGCSALRRWQPCWRRWHSVEAHQLTFCYFRALTPERARVCVACMCICIFGTFISAATATFVAPTKDANPF